MLINEDTLLLCILYRLEQSRFLQHANKSQRENRSPQLILFWFNLIWSLYLKSNGERSAQIIIVHCVPINIVVLLSSIITIVLDTVTSRVCIYNYWERERERSKRLINLRRTKKKNNRIYYSHHIPTPVNCAVCYTDIYSRPRNMSYW